MKNGVKTTENTEDIPQSGHDLEHLELQALVHVSCVNIPFYRFPKWGNVAIETQIVVQWLPLGGHSKRVLGLNLLASWGLLVWIRGRKTGYKTCLFML